MADNMKKNPYEDMLDMPYPFPTNRPRMSMYDRAAQFGSFAALTGHEEAIEETARFTATWVEPDETVKEELNRKLQMIKKHLEEQKNRQPQLGQTPLDQAMLTARLAYSYAFTYFMPDERKSGGAYETVKGQVKKLDELRRTILMMDGTVIPIDYIVGIDMLR